MSGSDPDRDRIRFGEFELDVKREALFGPGGEIGLRPKSFAVLSHLARHPGRVVSRDELLDTVWERRVVTEDSLTQCLVEIRRALGAEGRKIVRTLPRRGYLFDLPVAPPGQEDAGTDPSGVPAGPTARQWTSRKPVIAALRLNGTGERSPSISTSRMTRRSWRGSWRMRGRSPRPMPSSRAPRPVARSLAGFLHRAESALRLRIRRPEGRDRGAGAMTQSARRDDRISRAV
jgi:DNA-binding winged helix-turn-helix (wHTH) protein